MKASELQDLLKENLTHIKKQIESVGRETQNQITLLLEAISNGAEERKKLRTRIAALEAEVNGMKKAVGQALMTTDALGRQTGGWIH